MSKTPGQVAFEAAIGDAVKTPYEILAPFSKWNWEAAANAIIEECAKALEDVDCNANDPCEVLRALKSTGGGQHEPAGG